MTTEMMEPAATEPPVPNLLSRAVGVVISPKATFERIAARPLVFGAMALVALIIALTVGGFMASPIGQDAMRASFEARGGTPEGAAGFEKMLPYMGVISGISAFVWVPIFTFVVSGILFVVFNVIMGGTATFRQVLAVMAHSQFVSVLGTLFTFGLNYARRTMESATNLRAFFPDVDPVSLPGKLLNGADLFFIWWLIVLAIGLAVLYRRKTAGIVIGLVVAYFLLIAAFAAILPSRMGS